MDELLMPVCQELRILIHPTLCTPVQGEYMAVIPNIYIALTMHQECVLSHLIPPVKRFYDVPCFIDKKIKAQRDYQQRPTAELGF